MRSRLGSGTLSLGHSPAQRIQRQQKRRRCPVCRYVERPFLVSRRKFDIRQWVLISQWSPLTVWFLSAALGPTPSPRSHPRTHVAAHRKSSLPGGREEPRSRASSATSASALRTTTRTSLRTGSHGSLPRGGHFRKPTPMVLAPGFIGLAGRDGPTCAWQVWALEQPVRRKVLGELLHRRRWCAQSAPAHQRTAVKSRARSAYRRMRCGGP